MSLQFAVVGSKYGKRFKVVTFTRRVLDLINWIRGHKALMVVFIIFSELVIGVLDYVTRDEISLAGVHYLPIMLAAIIYGMSGVIVVSAAATISFYLATWLSVGRPLEQLTVPSVILTFVISILAGASALLILRLMISLQATNQTLSEKVSQLQSSSARIELLTAERERTRLARELHDGVAKTLLGVEYSAAALAQSLSPENSQAREKARFIQDVCHNEGQQLREVILDLREGYKEPLFQLITEYLQRWQLAYEPRVSFATHGSDAELSFSLVYEVMAIFEEALENVQRHSQAKQVWVRLDIEGEVQLEIRDNGKGLSPELLDYFQKATPAAHSTYFTPPWRGVDGRPRFGLTGMLERAEWLGGKLKLAPAPEGGLCIMVRVPLHPAEAEISQPTWFESRSSV